LRKHLLSIALCALCTVGSCARPPRAPESATTAVPAQTARRGTADVDPLGPRPIPAPAAQFRPPQPEVVTGPGQLRVWLLERHDLPIVKVAIVFPYGGSAHEPAAKGGLAHVAAAMMTQGAGDMDSLAFSSAVADLGAKLTASADLDATTVTLEVLTSRLDAGLSLLADAAVRPRDDKKDWDRVRSLWVNGLKARAHDPDEVARVVTAIAHYGDQHPYGRPRDGTRASASRVSLSDVVLWHKTALVPDDATFIIVGDVTKDEIMWRLASAFHQWTEQGRPALRAIPNVPAAAISPVKTVVVDRPDAQQVVLSLAKGGAAAGDRDRPRLDMLNLALGGSYTSRLNQNLREDHGWTYGARSQLDARTSCGMFAVRTAVRADAISEALRETKSEIEKMATEPLSATEVAKLRALVHGRSVEQYGTMDGSLKSLTSAASLRLGPDHDAKTLDAQLGAAAFELAALAPKFFSLSEATVVLVGPKTLCIEALSRNGFAPPEERDTEGNRVRAR
jgi:zinc protease